MALGEHEDNTLDHDNGSLPLCPLTLDRTDATSVAVGQPLDATHLHEAVVVVQLGGARGFRRRLMELGFVPGTQVRVRNIAPLGDPLELELRGCRVSIRRAEAAGITVRPVAAAG